MDGSGVIIWSARAASDYQAIILKLKIRHSVAAEERFIKRLETSLKAISMMPRAFCGTEFEGVYKFRLTRRYSLYYEVGEKEVTLLSFFNMVRHPLNLHI